MKKLELLQQEKLGIGYIKSYPILKQLPITPIQIEILQLVLSYQSNNQDFHMGYDKIAQILSSTTNSITKNISILNKNNYIQTNHTSNYNGKDGGSSTSIKVNMDYIIKLLTQVNSNELSQQSNTNIPQEEIKPLKSNNNDIEKQVEMKAEELDKILTERQNGDFNPTSVKNTIVEKQDDLEYETTIKNNQGIEMKIDDDLVEYYNTKVKHKQGYVKKQLKSKSEFIMNMNLRDKMNSEIEIDINKK
jgi:hypothetical protein